MAREAILRSIFRALERRWRANRREACVAYRLRDVVDTKPCVDGSRQRLLAQSLRDGGADKAAVAGECD